MALSVVKMTTINSVIDKEPSGKPDQVLLCAQILAFSLEFLKKEELTTNFGRSLATATAPSPSLAL
jgi:hypothetical protein